MAAMPSTVLDRLYKPGPRFFLHALDVCQLALELCQLALVLGQEALDLRQQALQRSAPAH